MPNPIGIDGYPMENHHIARQDQNGQKNLIDRCIHQEIHAQEIAAVQDAFEKEGISGFNPNAWTAKVNDK